MAGNSRTLITGHPLETRDERELVNFYNLSVQHPITKRDADNINPVWQVTNNKLKVRRGNACLAKHNLAL